MTPEKETFARYVSAHTVIGYDSSARLYEFSKAMKLTKEDIVNDYGDHESLFSLMLGNTIWRRNNP